jgi:hypothetical protein
VSPAEKLLCRLQRVKRTGAGRWIASSPTREDRRPSLAIRELEDGRLLVHDFGGDDVAAVMAAAGLELSDLFPDQPGQHAKPERRPFSASDVLSMVSFEIDVAVVVCADVLRHRSVSQADFDRLLTAARRLADAAEVCHGRR